MKNDLRIYHNKMENELRKVYSKEKKNLEKALSETELTPEQKKLLRNALSFGYAAAFCKGTLDMNKSFYRAQKYQDGYEMMKKRLT